MWTRLTSTVTGTASALTNGVLDAADALDSRISGLVPGGGGGGAWDQSDDWDEQHTADQNYAQADYRLPSGGISHSNASSESNQPLHTVRSQASPGRNAILTTMQSRRPPTPPNYASMLTDNGHEELHSLREQLNKLKHETVAAALHQEEDMERLRREHARQLASTTSDLDRAKDELVNTRNDLAQTRRKLVEACKKLKQSRQGTVAVEAAGTGTVAAMNGLHKQSQQQDLQERLNTAVQRQTSLEIELEQLQQQHAKDLQERSNAAAQQEMESNILLEQLRQQHAKDLQERTDAAAKQQEQLRIQLEQLRQQHATDVQGSVVIASLEQAKRALEKENAQLQQALQAAHAQLASSQQAVEHCQQEAEQQGRAAADSRQAAEAEVAAWRHKYDTLLVDSEKLADQLAAVQEQQQELAEQASSSTTCPKCDLNAVAPVQQDCPACREAAQIRDTERAELQGQHRAVIAQLESAAKLSVQQLEAKLVAERAAHSMLLSRVQQLEGELDEQRLMTTGLQATLHAEQRACQSAQEEVLQLQSQILSASAQLQQDAAQRGDVQQQLQRTQEELRCAQEELNDMQKALDSATARCSELDSQCKRHHQAAQENGERYHTEHVLVEQLRNEVQRLQRQVVEKEQEVLALRGDLDHLQQQIEDRASLTTTLQAELQAVCLDRDYKQGLLEEQQKDNNVQQERVAALQADLAAQVALVEEQRAQLQAVQQHLQEEVEAAVRLREQYESQHSEKGQAAEQELIKLRAAYVGLKQQQERQLQELHSQLEQQETVVQQWEAHATGLDQQLQQRDVEAKEELQQYQERYQLLQEELLQLQADHAEVQQQLNALRIQQQRHVAASNSDAAALQRVRTELESARSEVLQAHSRQGALHQELQSTLRQLDDKSAAHDAALQRLAVLEGMVEDLSLRVTGSAAIEQVQQLQQQLEVVGQERDLARQQLTRLKQQLMQEQEEAEEIVRLQVGQEVEAAVSKVHQQLEEDKAQAASQLAALQLQLQQAETRIQQLMTDLAAWEDAVQIRDLEITNLQVALGELTFEAEAAEKLRHEHRLLQEAKESAEQQVLAAQGDVKRAQEESAALQTQCQQLQDSLASVKSRDKALVDECLNMRRALQESMKKVHLLNSDGGDLVDRRIIRKMLLTYFERGQNAEVLQLMCRMLGMDPQEVTRARAGKRRGILGLLRGPNGDSSFKSAGDGLADKWMEFLLQQVNEDPRTQADPATDLERHGSETTTQASGPSHVSGAPLHSPRARRFLLQNGSVGRAGFWESVSVASPHAGQSAAEAMSLEPKQHHGYS